jgi:hypothetical protein
MKKVTEMQDQDLDSLFAEARAQVPIESTALQLKILADAARLQLPLSVITQRKITSPRSRFFSRLAAAVGGKAMLAGVGTAAIAGVVLGFAQPASLTTLTGSLFAEAPLDQLDLFPSIDDILTEG